MARITLDNLKPYQTRAAGELAQMLQEFPSPRLRPRFNPETGAPLPFLCRLRAVTGAGKTPILAAASAQLQNGIILWTTNRGAIIAQTRANLESGGKYASLLPEGTNVYILGDMTPQDWREVTQSQTGLSILLATVASFNQEGDTLKIHQQRGDTTYWEMLGGTGPFGRKRSLYVYYDEGHGATAKQFTKLRELEPKAFLLASASPLPDDFYDLLPGSTQPEREASLTLRTVAVPTPEVVAAGLLKTRLYLVDCDIASSDAIAEANRKWQELATKFAPMGEFPISCYIVNDTQRGVDVWEELISLGVPAGRIAVHLANAEATMIERRGVANGLIDTYKAKKQPEDLRSEGYTHLVWNLTLREGWDEPMAYVAYIDGKGKSVTDMTQKIGRFVRQPNAAPYDDPDLNSAYFYFRATDEEFTNLIQQMQEEMTVDGYEVIALKAENGPKPSREVPCKEDKAEMEVPLFGETFGEDLNKLDNILLKGIPLFAEEALKAKGTLQTRVFNVGDLQEEEMRRKQEARASNEAISIYEFVMSRLGSIDPRIVGKTGTRFSSVLRDQPKMKQKMQYGSEAMAQMGDRLTVMRQNLDEEFHLGLPSRHSIYPIGPFKLTAPDMTGGTELTREKYKVRQYQNAVHAEYNGLNPFEVEVAAALDALAKTWCRNPSKTGYGIPIAELGAESRNFYPDFLLWTETEIWAIDPKGSHLKEAAVQNKLFDVSDAGGTLPVRVALILQGKFSVSNNGSWSRDDKDGYTLARRRSGQVKIQTASNVSELIRSLLV